MTAPVPRRRSHGRRRGRRQSGPDRGSSPGRTARASGHSSRPSGSSPSGCASRRGTRRSPPPRRWAYRTGGRGAREAASVGLLVTDGHHPSLRWPQIATRCRLNSGFNINYFFVLGFCFQLFQILYVRNLTIQDRKHFLYHNCIQSLSGERIFR